MGIKVVCKRICIEERVRASEANNVNNIGQRFLGFNPSEMSIHFGI